MPVRDIITIGCSAGGVEALKVLVAGLPRNLAATVFIVLHLYPRSESVLPEILSRSGPLKASHAVDGERTEQGRIYVATPDQHLVVERHHLHLNSGPKEQHQRPSVNVMFRSAALAYGGRVVGVVLTGQLDDGTAGLWDIKRRGGVTIAQDPEEATFPSMPLSAIRDVEVDYTPRLSEIGPLLARLATEEIAPSPPRSDMGEVVPQMTALACPDCRGVMSESPLGHHLEFRCRVGHIFSAQAILAEQFAAQGRLLHGAVVSLEESASLTERLAEHLLPDMRRRLLAQAHESKQQAAAVRRVLEDRVTSSLD